MLVRCLLQITSVGSRLLECEAHEGRQTTPQYGSPGWPSDPGQKRKPDQGDGKVLGIMYRADPHWIVKGGGQKADDDRVDTRQHACRHGARTQGLPKWQHA